MFFSLFCTCYENHAFSRVFRGAGLRFRACFKAVCSSLSPARSSKTCRKQPVLLRFSRFAGRAVGLLFFTPALARFSTLFRNVAKITRFHAFIESWPPTWRSFWNSGSSFSAFPELRHWPENINFEPVSPKAKVVVNSRTGTVVIGGDVRISPAAVAHGSLSVKIQEDTKLLSEGTGTVVGTSATVAGTAATTAQETDIEVDQQPARAFVFDPGIELQTLVDALNETGTTATDMVAILEALREAGALRAELIII